MLALVVNIVLGVLPAFALGANISAQADEDDLRRRTLFFLVYGLWSLSLASWNWMRGTHVSWIILWSLAGAVSLAASFLARQK